jgi:hypothetical protein
MHPEAVTGVRLDDQQGTSVRGHGDAIGVDDAGVAGAATGNVETAAAGVAAQPG